ncbi:hypothetical protein VOLCADRAFT_87899 [Volvox carteri f. nagariensis]|uniref:Uncharacterized protein n=1 Tax=Volvox carteri f. nagariensis TaxID=3068 RepID=D8TMJ2_VOLCA|nr:uncharacterized protein VOLCADRAFT_87899 [Volvox carteri f. nagariensis]EFJ51266.1 hypothetical protein VOLCADRAFT_87899 [Volvox carteri f. nagariensis]|eukprot:XP_002947733.1 hypothetical protein VOLCADRAFT_87899 [Volvox carteri f. nagariensis]
MTTAAPEPATAAAAAAAAAAAGPGLAAEYCGGGRLGRTSLGTTTTYSRTGSALLLPSGSLPSTQGALLALPNPPYNLSPGGSTAAAAVLASDPTSGEMRSVDELTPLDFGLPPFTPRPKPGQMLVRLRAGPLESDAAVQQYPAVPERQHHQQHLQQQLQQQHVGWRGGATAQPRQLGRAGAMAGAAARKTVGSRAASSVASPQASGKPLPVVGPSAGGAPDAAAAVAAAAPAGACLAISSSAADLTSTASQGLIVTGTWSHAAQVSPRSSEVMTRVAAVAGPATAQQQQQQQLSPPVAMRTLEDSGGRWDTTTCPSTLSTPSPLPAVYYPASSALAAVAALNGPGGAAGSSATVRLSAATMGAAIPPAAGCVSSVMNGSTASMAPAPLALSVSASGTALAMPPARQRAARVSAPSGPLDSFDTDSSFAATEAGITFDVARTTEYRTDGLLVAQLRAAAAAAAVNAAVVAGTTDGGRTALRGGVGSGLRGASGVGIAKFGPGRRVASVATLCGAVGGGVGQHHRGPRVIEPALPGPSHPLYYNAPMTEWNEPEAVAAVTAAAAEAAAPAQNSGTTPWRVAAFGRKSARRLAAAAAAAATAGQQQPQQQQDQQQNQGTQGTSAVSAAAPPSPSPKQSTIRPSAPTAAVAAAAAAAAATTGPALATLLVNPVPDPLAKSQSSRTSAPTMSGHYLASGMLRAHVSAPPLVMPASPLTSPLQVPLQEPQQQYQSRLDRVAPASSSPTSAQHSQRMPLLLDEDRVCQWIAVQGLASWHGRPSDACTDEGDGGDGGRRDGGTAVGAVNPCSFQAPIIYHGVRHALQQEQPPQQLQSPSSPLPPELQPPTEPAGQLSHNARTSPVLPPYSSRRARPSPLKRYREVLDDGVAGQHSPVFRQHAAMPYCSRRSRTSQAEDGGGVPEDSEYTSLSAILLRTQQELTAQLARSRSPEPPVLEAVPEPSSASAPTPSSPTSRSTSLEVARSPIISHQAGVAPSLAACVRTSLDSDPRVSDASRVSDPQVTEPRVSSAGLLYTTQRSNAAKVYIPSFGASAGGGDGISSSTAVLQRSGMSVPTTAATAAIAVAPAQLLLIRSTATSSSSGDDSAAASAATAAVLASSSATAAATSPSAAALRALNRAAGSRSERSGAGSVIAVSLGDGLASSPASSRLAGLDGTESGSVVFMTAAPALASVSDGVTRRLTRRHSQSTGELDGAAATAGSSESLGFGLPLGWRQGVTRRLRRSSAAAVAGGLQSGGSHSSSLAWKAAADAAAVVGGDAAAGYGIGGGGDSVADGVGVQGLGLAAEGPGGTSAQEDILRLERAGPVQGGAFRVGSAAAAAVTAAGESYGFQGAVQGSSSQRLAQISKDADPAAAAAAVAVAVAGGSHGTGRTCAIPSTHALPYSGDTFVGACSRRRSGSGNEAGADGDGDGDGDAAADDGTDRPSQTALSYSERTSALSLESSPSATDGTSTTYGDRGSVTRFSTRSYYSHLSSRTETLEADYLSWRQRRKATSSSPSSVTTSVYRPASPSASKSISASHRRTLAVDPQSHRSTWKFNSRDSAEIFLTPLDDLASGDGTGGGGASAALLHAGRSRVLDVNRLTPERCSSMAPSDDGDYDDGGGGGGRGSYAPSGAAGLPTRGSSWRSTTAAMAVALEPPPALPLVRSRRRSSAVMAAVAEAEFEADSPRGA